MKTLHRMLLESFLPVFLFALIFFAILLHLIDLFGNLWRYLNHDAALMDIVAVHLYYLPKSISYALPVALLFAIAYTLGSLYGNNELIAVFGSGVPLPQFVAPFLVVGLILSVGWFFFQERLVIDTFAKKNELSRELLNQSVSLNNTDITVIGRDGRLIYHATYYNDTSRTLSNLLIIERDSEGDFMRRIDAEWAVWRDGLWELHRVQDYRWDEGKENLAARQLDILREAALNDDPSTFQKKTRNIEEMKMGEAREWLDSLRTAGLPNRGPLTEYYNRFAFALTPFVVALLSSAIGGRFRKNVLLMSLLSSLVLSVIYFVTQMVSVILAKLGYIPPLMGAWMAFLLFLAAGIGLFRIART